ncbi:uncharacterized protein B0I36DRAFT_43839 [Microdochium trichocladiopsis]|uniref:Uncharacterized protein n=1 Tax=Microdochium trichocladiopsis TaxID=1682393 RepID=A0A9P8XUL7_9PEZI|nr:uncharacterized protein B0I36DRAFT_43839 [Microdochium trichocladiopsis]KAH7016229.1 hypothetical protein B0I36DRAFT_43839 [Microdochium trichocladiopsis]
MVTRLCAVCVLPTSASHTAGASKIDKFYTGTLGGHHLQPFSSSTTYIMTASSYLKSATSALDLLLTNNPLLQALHHRQSASAQPTSQP